MRKSCIHDYNLDNIENLVQAFFKFKNGFESTFLKECKIFKNITLASICKKFQTTFEYALSLAEGQMRDVVTHLNVRYKKAYSEFLKELSLLPQDCVLDKDDDLFDFLVHSMVHIKLEDAQKLQSIFDKFSAGTTLINDLATIWYIERNVKANIAVFVGDHHRENIVHYLKWLGHTCEGVHNVDHESFERTIDIYKNQCENLLDPEVIKNMIAALN
jgi:hypothetical protein